MAVAHLKLLTALALGGTAGVAALATMTGAPAARLTPTGDSGPAAPRPVVTTSTAPCPAGTTETRDACVEVVQVPAPASTTVAPAAPQAPEPTRDTRESEPPQSPEATHTEDSSPEPQESPEQHDGGDQGGSDG